MSQFKNKKEFDDFCDRSMWCVCGKLMTGFHISGCRKLKKIEMGLSNE